MQDMRSFCTVLPYADIVVAEKLFTDLARQAGFHREYGVHLHTNLAVLLDLLE